MPAAVNQKTVIVEAGFRKRVGIIQIRSNLQMSARVDLCSLSHARRETKQAQPFWRVSRAYLAQLVAKRP